ncbi:CPBP family intramembrane metalloprotease [Streptomyces bathyalis]|uniref:CPBP family intramembrane metalloprotease n=1 Tax=Streptomyces bathyalis TaxID=2710756 RepID=A0A7T1WR79_9ACTN|nr:type II CAAX endopeptidase family protein [Streptomyces bathyalis]QPP07718.1 CPBP family intramembrane metalloprotease [Streptomyces bathyalis]
MNSATRSVGARFTRPNLLLDGMQTAARPTGPALSIVMGLVIFGVGSVLLAPVVVALEGTSQQGGFRETLLALLGGFLPPLLLLLLWVRWKEGRSALTLGFQTSRAGRSIGFGAGLALVMFSLPVFLNVVSGQMHFTAHDGEWVRSSQLGAVLVLLLAFTVQGSTEEIFTRGYLLQAVNRKWGLRSAMVTQTVFFSAMHLANPSALRPLPILSLALVAVFLGFWALREGGLVAVCAWHAVWNWTQGNVFGIRVSGNELQNSLLTVAESSGASSLLTGGASGIEGSVLATLVLSIGIVFACRAWRRRP